MVTLDRPVRFEEIDAAGIVFFAHFATIAHDALVHFFAPLEGGYAGLIQKRRVGLPTVAFGADFKSPARFGDVLRVETRVEKLGSRSAALRHEIRQPDGRLVATLAHTVVTTDLDRVVSVDMPADVRALFEAHVEPAAASEPA